MLPHKEFHEFDPAKKDEKYAIRKVTHLATLWKPLVSDQRMKDNMAFLFGNFDNEAVKKIFKLSKKKKIEDLNIDLRPLNLMEKIRNILVGENENAGLHVEANATDPTATTQKKYDRDLLENGELIETTLNALRSKLKKPPFKISDQKEAFNGNADKFSDMGMDRNSPEDIEHFMSVHYRLRHEIKSEELINFVFKFNECPRMLPKISNDILAVKAMSVMTFVDVVGGPIHIKYLAPNLTYWIPRKREDGKDALCKGYKESVSVGEFLERVGDDFKWDRDWAALLEAVNSSSGRMFTGIGSNGNVWGSSEVLCSMSDFMLYMIPLGYIEWKETDIHTWKYTPKNVEGNPRVKKAKFGSKTDPNHKSKYTTKQDEYQVIYSAYFIDTTGTSDIKKLWKYGKVPYQQVEGTADEIANYTIRSYVDTGKSAVEIAIPHLLKFEKLFKKYDYLINEIMPPGTSYDASSLHDVIPFIKDKDGQIDIMGLIEMLKNSPDKLHTSKDSDGNQVGGSGYPHQQIDNGLKAIADILGVLNVAMDKCVNDINSHLGISPVREAYAPNERDGFKLQMQTLESSRLATSYIGRMIGYTFTDVGYAVNNYTQYIINFKELNRRPYDWILNGIGDQSVNDLKYLEKVAAHRYSIFLEPTNSKYMREKVQQYIDLGYERGQIKPEIVWLLNTIESPKRAMQVLAYETQKAQRLEQKNLDAISQRKIAEKQSSTQADIALEQVKGKFMVEGKRIEGEYYYRAAVDAEKIRMAGVTAKLQAAPIEIAAQKDADIQVQAASQEAAATQA